MSQSRRRTGKYRITYEMLRNLIGLPDNIKIDTLVNDQDRNIVNFYLSSKEDYTVPPLFDHGEGQSSIETALEMGIAIENMRERVRLWDERQAQEDARSESREAMQRLHSQLTRDTGGTPNED